MTDPRGARWRRFNTSHQCSWPDCQKEVPVNLWGCRVHWFTLPPFLRDQLQHYYNIGEDKKRKPCGAYLNVAREAEQWAFDYMEKQQQALGWT